MPTVDGELSTRMIRFLEKESTRVPQNSKQRVPIIAVSASLYEDNRFDYIQSGYVFSPFLRISRRKTSWKETQVLTEPFFRFDGWLLKPIDFRRLDVILQGVKNPQLRRDALYVPGQWKKGGWFIA